MTTRSRLLAWIEEIGGSPSDSPDDEDAVRRLGALRLYVGALLLVRTTPLLFLVPGLRENHGGPLFGWPDGELHAAFAGVTIPVLAIKVLVVLRTFAALFFFVGLFARPAGLIAALLGYVVWSQEPFSFIFTLHALYLATALLALTDGVAARAIRPSPIRSPQSSITLMRAFVLSVYAWSALAKLHHRWLDGSVLRVLRDAHHVTGPIASWLLRGESSLPVVAWGTFIMEAAVVGLLVVRRSRVLGIVIACILHASFELSMHPDVFGWLMVGLLAVFWPTRPQSHRLPTS